jgi:hypothetical protein
MIPAIVRIGIGAKIRFETNASKRLVELEQFGALQSAGRIT